MLFPYKYVTHEIERYQGYLDYLFYQVWYPAQAGVYFSDELLAGHPGLQIIYQELHNVDGDVAGKKAYRFSKGVQAIYNLFKTLPQPTREWLRNGYEANNEIERLCSDKTFIPITYADIAVRNEELAEELKSFYKGVYTSESFFDLKAFGSMYSIELYNHFKAFTTKNDEGVCPFCGINNIKGPDDKYRDAYDHYLPKSIYPFTAINFRNLVPMCHECNSTEKGTLEPIFTDTKDRSSRVLAYYPFAAARACPDFKITIANPDPATLTHEDITLSVTAPDCEEQIESWFRVFGLERRYKSQLTKKNAGKRWLNLIFSANYRDERRIGTGILSNKNLTSALQFSMLVSNSRLQPYAELGFLKSSFLTACFEAGMFEDLGIDE